MAKEAGHGTRRSILVMTVSGEEKGLLGSEWYSEYPIFPLENTVCDLNIDMIGRIDEAHSDDGELHLSDRVQTNCLLTCIRYLRMQILHTQIWLWIILTIIRMIQTGFITDQTITILPNMEFL